MELVGVICNLEIAAKLEKEFLNKNLPQPIWTGELENKFNISTFVGTYFQVIFENITINEEKVYEKLKKIAEEHKNEMIVKEPITLPQK